MDARQRNRAAAFSFLLQGTVTLSGGCEPCDTRPRKETPIAPDYRGYRFPPETSAHAAWLYFRFALSLRDVEELLAAWRVVVSDATIRR